MPELDTPSAIYLVQVCVTTVAGVAAVSLDQFQRPFACAFAALGAVSPWALLAIFIVPLYEHTQLSALFWIGLHGSWLFFVAAAVAFLLKRPGPPNRKAAAASLAGVLAGGATTLLAVAGLAGFL